MQPQKTVEEKPAGKKKGKEGNKGPPKLKDLVFKMIPCLYPQVIDHILAANNVNGDLKIESEEEK